MSTRLYTRCQSFGIFAFVSFLLSWGSLSLAQITNGRIVGTTTDATGAAMANVTVTALNVDTNAHWSARTENTGAYIFPDLPIGNYEVSFEASGFKRYVASSLKLLVDQTLRVDARLQVGNVQQNVEVSGQTPVIATDQSSLGEVMQNKEVVQLPLNGRNFLEVANLAAGSTQGSPNYANRFRSFGTVMTSNGGRGDQNSYLIDGLDNTGYILGTPLVEPSIDAIEEIRVQTANFTADMGQSTGAVINIATKSGSNQFHGTLYEFLRNDIFDATNYFATPSTKPPLRQNQFGGSVGGPIIKNRLFFFFNYEGFRQSVSAPYSYLVPTPAMKNGDFSGSWLGSPLPTLYDPLSLDANGNRLPFPCNKIPASRISPIATALFPYMPDPNSTSPAGNYQENLATPAVRNQYNSRLDYTINSKDSIMVRDSYWNANLDQHYLNFEGSYWHWSPRNGVVGWTHTYSPNIVQEVRAGASRYSEIVGIPYSYNDYNKQWGLPEFPIGSEGSYAPEIITNNMEMGLEGNQPSARIENHFQGQYHLDIIHGRNAIKVGADVMRYQSKDGYLFNMGLYEFSGGFTAPIGETYTNGFGDMLLGFPNFQQIQDPIGWDYERLRNTRVQSYVQDDIRATPNLTLNVGLRWDWYSPWKEIHNRISTFDFATGEVVYPAALTLPYSLPFPHVFSPSYNAIQNAQNKQFGPRVGFAWRPFGNDRTTVQAAYGIFWGNVSGYLTGSQFDLGAGLALVAALSASTTIAPSLVWGQFGDLTNPANFTLPGVYATAPTIQNPYVGQWNFGINHELMRNTALRVLYVGSKTTHLDGQIPANLALPPAAGNYLTRLAYPVFGPIESNITAFWSNYNALQLSVERRFSEGLMFTSNFTLSKCLDSVSDFHAEYMIQNPTNLRQEYGRCEQDVHYRFTTSLVYELPVQTKVSLLRPLVEGWQAGGVINFQSGFPFPVTANDTSNIGDAGNITMRANYVGGPMTLPSGQRNPVKWFNTAAFAQPAPYTFGDTSRDIIDGPGFNNLDLSLMKLFPIGERVKLQFRFEAFDAFNHPYFGLPNTNISSPTVGSIGPSGSVYDSNTASNREIQFALKLIF
jgi:hypothetical protein